MNIKIVTLINKQIEGFLNVLDSINPKFRFVFLGSCYIIVVFSIITKVSKNILQPTELETYTSNFKLYTNIQDILFTLFQSWVAYVTYIGLREGMKK